MNSGNTDFREHDGEDTTYDHVLKYTGVFGGVQVLSMLVSVLRNKLAAHWLSKAGLGFFMIFSNAAAFVSSASNAGLPFSAVRNISELYEEGDSRKLESFIVTIRAWSLWTALFGALLCVLLAPPISYFAFDRDWSYSNEVAFLAPMVFALAITNGEISILKGTRKLKRVAMITAVSALITLVSVLPFFCLWRIDGIIPALVVNSFAIMGVHLYFSLQVYPWRVKMFSREVLRQGWEMIKLGLPYVVASILNSLTALAIPSILVSMGGIDDVGLYKVGYGLMVVYAGIVFVAVEADYFPRLSAVSDNTGRLNRAINQQIDICVLLISPLLIFMMLTMPLIIQIVSTNEFLPVVNMAVCSAFYMFFRAIMLPIGYASLAKGDSITYLLMEFLYDVYSFIFIALGYYIGNITGTGIALSIASLVDMLIIAGYYSRKYGFRFFPSTMRLSIVQCLLLSAGLYLCLQPNLLLRYTLGGMALLASAIYSFHILYKRTTFITALKDRISRKFKK